MYDIVIVGAGPAGSTLARLLPEHMNVLLIDKRNLSSKDNFKKEKACGGLISPDAQKMLAYFDLGVPKSVLQDPQLFAVKVIDIDNNLEANYQRNYLNIDREKFDRWLYDLVPSSVTKLENTTVKSILYEKEDYTLYVNQDGKELTINTKYLVGADGANSIVRKSFFPRSRIKKYVSIQKWYEQDSPINHYIALFDKDLTDYYSWTISKDKYLIVGSAFIEGKGNPNELFKQLEYTLTKQGYDLSKPVKQEGSFILRPGCICHIELGKDHHFLIGEAAGYISPSSAEGYSYAFRTALYLTEAFSKKHVHRTYKRKCRKLNLNLVYKWLKHPFMYNRFIRKIILKSKVMSIK